ncbi:MAG: hypothetical protein ACKPKO_53200, partial [Candidatus Fonsibacter sp.]
MVDAFIASHSPQKQCPMSLAIVKGLSLASLHNDSIMCVSVQTDSCTPNKDLQCLRLAHLGPGET